MPTPIIITPIVYSHAHHNVQPGEDKQILAFWLALHLLPLLIILCSWIFSLIEKDKYYDILEDNSVWWIILMALFGIDLLALLSFLIYKIL